MTVRNRARVIPGTLAVAVLGAGLNLGLTACSSQGTIGTGTARESSPPAVKSSATAPSSAATDTSVAPAPSSSQTAAPATSSSATSSPSQDPSALASSLKTLNSLWKDQGCKTALNGFSVYLYAQQKGAAQGIAAIPTAVPQIRRGAQQTKKPQATEAMNKLAADLLTMYTQAQEGKSPDKGPVRSDWQLMGGICSQQQP